MRKILALLFILRRPILALLKPFSSLIVLGAMVAAMRRLLQKEADLHGQVALITGGSRGLGLLMAEAFSAEGCRLVICARDGAELERAAAHLRRQGATVLPVVCDVADPAAVHQMVARANSEMGGVDILVNNAGIMDVGALETHDAGSYKESMDVIFWGTLYPTFTLLPQMRARGAGRIVNITSIGGRASIPHLQPYAAAKFAAVGFSEGLRAELAGKGITVTTITPGLMRTGSFLNAMVRGDHEKEFSWFALGASLPFISMDARRAARQIVEATRRGEAERTLSLPATILARLHGVAPGFTADLLGVARRLLLPEAGSKVAPRLRGWDVQRSMAPSKRSVLQQLTVLGQDAARRLNQLAPEETALHQ